VAIDERPSGGWEFDPLNVTTRGVGQCWIRSDLEIDEAITKRAKDEGEHQAENANPPGADGRADCRDGSGLGARSTAFGHPSAASSPVGVGRLEANGSATAGAARAPSAAGERTI
jgi:hypothetical protein